MEVSEAIRSRRSVRKFKDRQVPREDLVELVDYA
ncbi:MAG: nitroreductase family protein, partial [Candidatus Bipolaricaulia bacterium]